MARSSLEFRQEPLRMDAFLEEQLRRLRELTRQITSAERRAAELSDEIERERRNLRRSPWHEVRDLRTYSGTSERSTARDERPARRHRTRRRRRR